MKPQKRTDWSGVGSSSGGYDNEEVTAAVWLRKPHGDDWDGDVSLLPIAAAMTAASSSLALEPVMASCQAHYRRMNSLHSLWEFRR